jgi:hypothetical protein
LFFLFIKEEIDYKLARLEGDENVVNIEVFSEESGVLLTEEKVFKKVEEKPI